MQEPNQIIDFVSNYILKQQKLYGKKVLITAGPTYEAIDAVRFIHGYDKKLYSWWSYRSKDWKKSNRGRRLDHIWISKKLLPHLKDVSIEKEIRGWKRPSDHVPIIVDLDLT